jgi:mannose-6-phosphate isomerase-like protein (cupin superfamily)
MRTSSGSPGKSNYSVKHVETIADGADVRVRLFTLAPGEIIPWHYHSQCSDHYFVLEGTLTVRTRHPERQSIIKIGASHRLAPQTIHQISNQSEEDCRFLLVQGVGALDWVQVED